MNVGKSIKWCLLSHDMSNIDLASRMDMTPRHISKLANSRTCKGTVIVKLAGIFKLKASEFIARGE